MSSHQQPPSTEKVSTSHPRGLALAPAFSSTHRRRSPSKMRPRPRRQNQFHDLNSCLRKHHLESLLPTIVSIDHGRESEGALIAPFHLVFTRNDTGKAMRGFVSPASYQRCGINNNMSAFRPTNHQPSPILLSRTYMALSTPNPRALKARGSSRGTHPSTFRHRPLLRSPYIMIWHSG